MAIYSLLENRSANLIATLAFFGLISSAISVFEPRVTGKFALTYKGAEFNLADVKSALEAERDLARKALIPLDEVVKEDE